MEAQYYRKQLRKWNTSITEKPEAPTGGSICKGKKKATPAEKVTLSQQFAGALIKRFECILAFYVKTYIQAQIYTYIKKNHK